MRKSQKLMITCLLLLGLGLFTVTPTLSWLSSTSVPVVNTFAGGSISLKVDEALVDINGKAIVGEGAQRVTANSYKYIAGATLDKDPTVTVLRSSEECYIFLCIDNQLDQHFTMNYDTASWLEVASSNGKTVYAYHTKVNALNSQEDIVLSPIFTTVTIANDLTAQDIENLGQRTLTITAYALQANSVTSQTAVDLAVAEFLPNIQASNYPEIN